MKLSGTQIVNLLTRSNYQELEPLLFKILENPAEDQKFRAWTVQHIGGLLTTPGDIPVSPDLLNRVRKILSDGDLHVRREALLALSRADDRQTLETVSGMLKSDSPEFDGMRDLANQKLQADGALNKVRKAVLEHVIEAPPPPPEPRPATGAASPRRIKARRRYASGAEVRPLIDQLQEAAAADGPIDLELE
jgi:hypothetical protein